MSVLLELNIGDVVIDLFTEYAPKTCENFCKLCKTKYYNFAPIYNVQRDFSFQAGDPIGPEGDGGTSIWGLLGGSKYFKGETHRKLKHSERGTVSMILSKKEEVGYGTSRFYITLGDNLEYLDGKHAIFGRVAEGFDVLEKINESLCDEANRPFKDIRILHTIVLDDPFEDPKGLVVPESSPPPSRAQLDTIRITDKELNQDVGLTEEELERKKRERQAEAEALTLEMVGDLPFARVKPPENILFVCKLNRATRDDDLELIFSRFGKILSCEIIKDKRTGDSLQYAFIEFAEQKDCEQAYFKMQDVLIDDSRIFVDFSQSVSRLSDAWRSSTNTKRRTQAALGFGGSSKLAKRTLYRDDGKRKDRDYDFVFEEAKRGRVKP